MQTPEQLARRIARLESGIGIIRDSPYGDSLLDRLALLEAELYALLHPDDGSRYATDYDDTY